MRRYFSVFLVAIILSFVIFGCDAISGIHMKTNNINYENEYVKVNAKIPVVSGIKNEQLEKTINQYFDDTYRSKISDFDKVAKQNPPKDGIAKYEIDITPELKTGSNKFLSILVEIYTFTSGAHGLTAREATNVNLVDGKTAVVKDLFKQGVNYERLLTDKMNEIINKKPDDYKDLWEKPTFTSEEDENFYIQDGNLVIYYPPYELASYVRGFVEFKIPLSELKEYLK